MRVITGSARGKRLLAPEGMDVRPTPDKVKEGVFSALQFDIEGRRILDLFAGSGQLSIEALSRGAKNAVLVDSSAASIKIIKSNLASCGFEDKARVYKTDYTAFCAMCNEVFDIAFLDPPYNAGLLMSAVKAVLPLMSDYGFIVCEHPPEVMPDNEVGGFSVWRTYRYGKVNVTIYRKSDKNEG